MARLLPQKVWGFRDRYRQKFRKVATARRRDAVDNPEGLGAARSPLRGDATALRKGATDMPDGLGAVWSILSEVAKSRDGVAKRRDRYYQRPRTLRRRRDKARSLSQMIGGGATDVPEVATRCGGVAKTRARHSGGSGEVRSILSEVAKMRIRYPRRLRWIATGLRKGAKGMRRAEM